MLDADALQFCQPMGVRTLERGSTVGIVIVGQSLDHLERECIAAMIGPRCLERSMCVAALPQREPQAVLNGGQIRRTAHPQLAGRHAPNSIDAGFNLAVSVGRNGRLSTFLLHA